MGKKFAPDYGTDADWRMRIRESVVYYEGKPVYVRDITSDSIPELEDQRAILREEFEQNPNPDTSRALEDIRTRINRERLNRKAVVKVINGKNHLDVLKSISVDIDDLDLTFKPIGMANYYCSKTGRSVCSYTSRVPLQQTRQGLTDRNIRNRWVTSKDRIRAHFGVYSVGFYSALTGTYPETLEALEKLFSMDGTNSLAFSRDYAFIVDEVGNVTVSHKGVSVGSYSQDTGTVTLMEKKQYLEDSLRELGLTG